MALQGWLTTREIGVLFAEELAEVGGKVRETYDDGTLLFSRSILPGTQEVGKGDRVQGGVAIKAIEGDILVHPYVFRQVCKNGAIRAQAIQTRHLSRDDFPFGDEEVVARSLREAVRASCAEDAFSASVEEMRSAREMEADMALAMMPLIASLPPKAAADVVQLIMRRHNDGRDRSGFGLMNAVTSVARDTRDPELRWRLEEFGGGIPALLRCPQPRPGALRTKVLAEV